MWMVGNHITYYHLRLYGSIINIWFLIYIRIQADICNIYKNIHIFRNIQGMIPANVFCIGRCFLIYKLYQFLSSARTWTVGNKDRLCPCICKLHCDGTAGSSGSQHHNFLALHLYIFILKGFDKSFTICVLAI